MDFDDFFQASGKQIDLFLLAFKRWVSVADPSMMLP